MQLVHAIDSGDVQSVRRCLTVKGIDVNAKLHYRTLAARVVDDHARADVCVCVSDQVAQRYVCASFLQQDRHFQPASHVSLACVA